MIPPPVPAVSAGVCVRVVPFRAASGKVDEVLAYHREHHTPAVRRQPGFLAKWVLQSEDDPDCLVMLLVWRTSADALAWGETLEHHETGVRARGLREGRSSAPRGGYRVLDVAGPV